MPKGIYKRVIPKKKYGIYKACCTCGKIVYLCQGKIKEHNFCSKKCSNQFDLHRENNKNLMTGKYKLDKSPRWTGGRRQPKRNLTKPCPDCGSPILMASEKCNKCKYL